MSAESALRGNVRLLGNILGATLVEQHGTWLLDLVELVRALLPTGEHLRAASSPASPAPLRARGARAAGDARGCVRANRGSGRRRRRSACGRRPARSRARPDGPPDG